MKNIAIITARGGSKRIPRKNIKEFCGKPIIAYSIEAALASGVFDEVMVSTDSKEIADIARSFGASVPFMRSEATSNDFATTADVLSEVVAEYEALGRPFESFCCIYPTAPFVTAEILREAMQKLERDNCDSVVPVVKFDFPPWRAFLIKDGFVEYQYPQYALARSQDLEPIYHDCGQFYCCKTASFSEHGTVIGPKTAPIVLPSEMVQDIDTPEDWAAAEQKFLKIKAQKEVV